MFLLWSPDTDNLLNSQFLNVTLFSHLWDDLCESTAGLVTDPHFVFGSECGANRLQLSIDRLVREGLDTQLRLAGGVQLQMVPHCKLRKTLKVHEQPADRDLGSSCF